MRSTVVEFKSIKDGWVLYNEGSYELCSESNKAYASLFDLSLVRRNHPSIKVLIIGGGDYQLINELVTYHDKDLLDITIVDPNLSRYKDHFIKMWGRTFEDIRIQEHECLYSEYLQNLDPEEQHIYDLILVDCSSPEVGTTSEIYNTSFLDSIVNTFIFVETKMFLEQDFFDDVLEYMKDKEYKYIMSSRYIPQWEDTAYVVGFSTH